MVYEMDQRCTVQNACSSMNLAIGIGKQTHGQEHKHVTGNRSDKTGSFIILIEEPEASLWSHDLSWASHLLLASSGPFGCMRNIYASTPSPHRWNSCLLCLHFHFPHPCIDHLMGGRVRWSCHVVHHLPSTRKLGGAPDPFAVPEENVTSAPSATASASSFFSLSLLPDLREWGHGNSEECQQRRRPREPQLGVHCSSCVSHQKSSIT